MVEHRTGTLPTQVRFPGAARVFLPESVFSADSLTVSVHTPPLPPPPRCAIAGIYFCAHVEDPVVHVRVGWIVETLIHPACTLGWVARLFRIWLSPGGGNGNFLWEKIPLGQYTRKTYKEKKQKWFLKCLVTTEMQ